MFSIFLNIFFQYVLKQYDFLDFCW